MSFYITIADWNESVTGTGIRYLYYPGDAVRQLTDIQLDLKIGEAGQLQFKIYPEHPLYDRITFDKSHIYMFRDAIGYGNIIFDGIISDIDRDMNKVLSVNCTGILGVLDFTRQPPSDVTTSVRYHVNSLISVHNSELNTGQGGDTANYDFYEATVLGDDRDTSIEFLNNYETTLEALRKDVCEPFGLYPSIYYRYESGSWMGRTPCLRLAPLDLYGELSNQTIEFGENLLQYADEKNRDTIYTAILPLGRQKDNTEKNLTPFPGRDYSDLDAYFNIFSVNDSSYILKNLTAISQYGFRCALIQWDWIDNPSTLKTKAQAWLNSYNLSQMRLTLTALDLSMLGANYSAFKIGDRVRCTATPLGLDVTLPIYEMTIYPLDPGNNTVTLGGETPTITGGGTTVDISGDEPSAVAASSIAMEIKTYTCSYSVGSGQYAALSANNFGVSTPSGYTPIGIQRIAAGNGNMLIRAYNAKATGDSAVINLYNNSSSTVSATATIDIVYVK